MDTQSGDDDSKMAKTTSRNVKMNQRGPRTQSLPYRLEAETTKSPGRQEHINIDRNDVHAPRNMPIKILGTRIEVLGRGEDVAASVEGEKDGSRDVKWNRDVGGTISGDDIESQQQRGWLQKVNIWVTMQDRDETTYQCRPSHPQTL